MSLRERAVASQAALSHSIPLLLLESAALSLTLGSTGLSLPPSPFGVSLTAIILAGRYLMIPYVNLLAICFGHRTNLVIISQSILSLMQFWCDGEAKESILIQLLPTCIHILRHLIFSCVTN